MYQPLRTLLLAAAAQWLWLSPSVQAAEEPPASSADAQTESADGRAQLQERQVETSAALQRALPETEQQQLQTAEEQFLALWRPAISAKPRGVVILLHGTGESADWPVTISPLRSKLPDAQWHTLSLSLPDPLPAKTDSPIPADQPGEAADAEASGDAPDNTAASDSKAEDPASSMEQQKAYASRVDARITTAIEFAKQSQPTEIILLGHGSGSFWATQFLSREKNSGVTRLLLISAMTPQGFKPPLEDSLPALTLAIGDFYFKDSPEQEAAVQRKQAAIRGQHKAYHQAALSALPGNAEVEQEQLYRRVRGWLEKPPAQEKNTAAMKKQPAVNQRKP
jgi:predicted esterase